MPYDKNGVQLRDGDIVTIHCKVRSIQTNVDEYNNITLETIEEHYPSNSYTTVILNSKQVEKIG
jgi:hypothetical protein